MSYLTVFKDFGVLDVELPINFNDVSWHGDACPCFEKQLTESKSLLLYIDYSDVNMREMKGVSRFNMSTNTNGESDDFKDFDKWQDVLDYIETVK